MRHEVVGLQSGWAGTNRTVAEMERLVQQGLQDPVVVSTAQNLVRRLPERDKVAEVRAVSNFVRGKIRYTNEGIETLKTPRLLLDEIRVHGKAVGDCDDHVILWASLHRALGNETRFKVVSQRADKLANHIYGEVHVPGRGWVTDDLIVKHKPLGWEVPKAEVTSSKTYQVGGLGMVHEFRPGGTARIPSVYFQPGQRMYAIRSRAPGMTHVRPARGPLMAGLGQEEVGPPVFGLEQITKIAEPTGSTNFLSKLTSAIPEVIKSAPSLIETIRKWRERKDRPVPTADVPPQPVATGMVCPPGYRPVVLKGLGGVGEAYQ